VTVKIALGTDHAGFEFKNQLTIILAQQGVEVMEVGAHTYDADDDYPDFAEAVARAVADGRADRGILVCGSGVGASIAATKVNGIRAAMCHDTYSARQGVEHDDMNVLCMGARIIGIELAREIAIAFLGASFSGEPRHARRLAKVMAIEATK
jgi:ribose 5-phosphate isomerase B